MVFYIVAYLDNKSKSEERSRDKVREKFPNMGGREQNELVDIKVTISLLTLIAEQNCFQSRLS
jgi:hypothetical protein